MRKKVWLSVFLCLVLTLLVGVSAYASSEEEPVKDKKEITDGLCGDPLSEEHNTDNPEVEEPDKGAANKAPLEGNELNPSADHGTQGEKRNPGTEEGAGDASADLSMVLTHKEVDEEIQENPAGDTDGPDAGENKYPEDALIEGDAPSQEDGSEAVLQGEIPAGDGSGTQQTESSGEAAYEILSLSFEVIQNQDYSGKNKTNCVLNFSFIDKSTSISYNGCITGFRVNSSDCAAIIEDIKKETSVFRNDLSKIIQGAASYYLSGHTSKDEAYDIMDSSTTWYELIDAEKYSGEAVGYGENQGPWGDGNLCWAASASNMLSYAGWSGNFTEDEVLTSFANAFFNEGLYQHSGVVWYLNGVNPLENELDENGDIWLRDTIVKKGSAASERNSYTGESIRVHSDYSAILLCNDYGTDMLDSFSDTLVDSVNNGKAVGLSICGNDPNDPWAHAQTVFGYICQSDLTGSLAMKALFISDSDTDYADSSPDKAMKNACNSEAERKNCVNRYKMFYTAVLSNYRNRPTFEVYTALPGTTPKDQTVVSGITVLENIKSVEALPKESGNGDSRRTIDIIPYRVEQNPDDPMSVEVEFKNQSYKAMISCDDAQIKITYDLLVYNSDKQYVASVPGEEPVFLSAMQSAAFVTPIHSLSPGTYYLLLRLNSIGYYFNDGQFVPIEEAFYQNNVLCWVDALRITIPELEPVSPTASEMIPIFCANYLFASNSELEIIFTRPSGMNTFIRLLNSDGEEISKEYYTITDNTDGTYTIVFTPDFLHTLRFGYNSLTLVGDNGKILFGITVM